MAAHLRPLLPLLTAFALAACGGGGSGGNSSQPVVPAPPASPAPPPSQPTPPSGGGGTPPPTLAGAALIVHSDTGRESSLLIGPEGGELSARASDGSRYRLLIPAGALPTPTTIRLRPVESIDGLPLSGGLSAAVELLPSGLSFAVPALLYVAPADSTAARIGAFSWSGDDDRFAVTLAGGGHNGAPYLFSIRHFSGYGLAIPGPSELSALAGDLIALDAAFLPYRERWNQLVADSLNAADPDRGPFVDLFLEMYDALIAPRLAAAPATPAAAIEAVRAVFHWQVLVDYVFSLEEPDYPPALATAYLDASDIMGIIVDHHDAYTRPACSATVTDWKDWLRVPEELAFAAGLIQSGRERVLGIGMALPERYCVSLELRELAFPRSIEPDTGTLDLAFRTVIALPGGNDIAIPAEVALSYSDGLSGDAARTAGADGHVAQVINRDVTGPDRATVELVVTETEVGRPDVLRLQERLIAGSTRIYFSENFDPAPRPILGFDQEVEACVYVAVGEPVGQTVNFELSGPGTLSAGSAVTTDALGVGQACVTYTTPVGYVGRHITADLRASVQYEGEELYDILRLHPAWAEIRLETDVGLGRVSANNRSFTVDNDGPFTVLAQMIVPGETTADRPGPAGAGEVMRATTAEPILGVVNGMRTDFDISDTDDDGVAVFHVGLSSSGMNHHVIEISTYVADDDVASGASLTLHRVFATPTLSVDFNGGMIGTRRMPLVLRMRTPDNQPVAGGYVELQPDDGGTVGATSGYLDANGELRTTARLNPDSNAMSIRVTLRDAPGGEIYDSADVYGARTVSGVLTLQGRLERASSQSLAEADGYFNTCGFGGSASACRMSGYGVNAYTASAGATGAVSQNIEGSSETGITAVNTTLEAHAGDGTGRAEANVMFRPNGLTPIRLRATCQGGATLDFYSRPAALSGDQTWIAYLTGYPFPTEGELPPTLTAPGVTVLHGGGSVEVDLFAQSGTYYTVRATSVAMPCPPDESSCPPAASSCEYELLTGEAADEDD
jgi:hypothetical protein